MVRRIVFFTLLLGTFADASIQMRSPLLRRLDTSTTEDSLAGPIMIYQTQQDALHDFFVSTEMNSELSRPRHNWRFLEETGFPTLHYCNFTGVGCDDDLFVLSLELNETMLAGTLPNSMGDLTRLVRIRVFNNTIGGLIPQSLAQISGLRNLNIGHNAFSGILPDFTGSALQRLILDRNSFTGTVPETLCNLHELRALDLSGSTKLLGSLPSCLGDLTFLSKLRITDSGLTGSVPTNLCNKRVMNNLSPNTYGCDAIGCATGSFQRRGGRQTTSDTACEACDVPSNVIGASVCQWYQPLPQPLPRQKAALPSQSITVSLAPTASPSSKARDDSVDWIVQPSGAQDSPPARGIISGCLVASVCFVVLGAAVLWKARSRRLLMYTDANGYQGERLTDDKKSDASESSSFAAVSEGADASATSRSTQRFFLEGDDMAFEENIITNHHGRPSILKTPILESTSSEDRSLNQRVRFKLPEPLPLSDSELPEPLPWSDSDEESVIMTKDHQQSPEVTGDAEAWVSWIMNPVFDSISACSPLDCTPATVHVEIDKELERSPSTDSSVNSMSPILPRFTNTSSDPELGAPETTPQVVSPEHEPTMGIQDRHRGDDSVDAVYLGAPETTPQVVSPEHEATMGIQDWHRGDDSVDAVYLEIGAVPVYLEMGAVPATERSQESGVLSQSSIVPQVSTDEDDDGLNLAGSEYGPGMYEI